MLSTAPTLSQAKQVIEERHCECFHQENDLGEHPDDILADLLHDLRKSTGIAIVLSFGLVAHGLTRGVRHIGHVGSSMGNRIGRSSSLALSNLLHAVGHDLGSTLEEYVLSLEKTLVPASVHRGAPVTITSRQSSIAN